MEDWACVCELIDEEGTTGTVVAADVDVSGAVDGGCVTVIVDIGDDTEEGAVVVVVGSGVVVGIGDG
jgi:predicted deacylase